MKASIRRNIYGNWNGYLGARKVREFGCRAGGQMDADEWFAEWEQKAKTMTDADVVAMLAAEAEAYRNRTGSTFHITIRHSTVEGR